MAEITVPIVVQLDDTIKNAIHTICNERKELVNTEWDRGYLAGLEAVCKIIDTFAEADGAIGALEKQYSYRWHDPVADPNDVPDNCRKVECRTRTVKGIVNPVFGYYDGSRWCCGMNSNVILWREVEVTQ